jgi:hypothetical protein
MPTNELSVTETNAAGSCSADRTCADSTNAPCGCGTDTADQQSAAPRRGIVAALLALACAAACLAVPFAAGAVAAVSGSVAGQWWVVAVVVAAAAVALVAVARRRGRIC